MSFPTEDRGRITARVSSAVVEKLQEAADLSGATLNQFLVQAALEKAQGVIDRERTIPFSADDAAMFIHMLDHPAPPNAALARAFERYRSRVNNGLIHSSAVSSAPGDEL
ncbi:MAG: DUF1778 domain-containing protein [Burkholderiaceae bacterium]|nr:DUF1778 domain-containing protein [Burkholderiaceae bacterium]